MNIREYAERMERYLHCSDECFILCILYIERMVQCHSQFVVTDLNVHRLLLTSLVVAAKFHDDVYRSNAHYAKVGGVTVNELAKLEAHFLKKLDWRVHVMADEYSKYFNRVGSKDASLCLRHTETCPGPSSVLQVVPVSIAECSQDDITGAATRANACGAIHKSVEPEQCPSPHKRLAVTSSMCLDRRTSKCMRIGFAAERWKSLILDLSRRSGLLVDLIPAAMAN